MYQAWVTVTSRLPEPNSDHLNGFVRGDASRAVYAVLFANQGNHLSMGEIRSQLPPEFAGQEHLNRRLRDLYGVFEIDRSRRGQDTVYSLIGMRDVAHQTSGRISAKVRAWVLRDQRCRQCGRTPAEDKVKLHVDHVIPQEWGGTDDPENLQALCSDCNLGKKNLYSSYNEFAPKIQEAINYDEPHKRIGELLKAFGGHPVPSELLEVVAKAKQYQEDWQKRLRELRELGWKISHEQERKGGMRTKTFYILEHSEPWPEGSVIAEIRKRERQKKEGAGS